MSLNLEPRYRTTTTLGRFVLVAAICLMIVGACFIGRGRSSGSSQKKPVSLQYRLSAPTSSVTFQWNANPEPNIAGYRLHWGGQAGGPYPSVQDTGNVTLFTLLGIGPAQTFVVLTALNTATMESGFSNEVSIIFPSPTPAVSISGTISYCYNPVANPIPNVTVTLSGDATGTTLTDSQGNYTFSSLTSGGNYVVTPTKSALMPGATEINTVDIIAMNQHFLNIQLLTGCLVTVGDVNSDGRINTVDMVATQRFLLGVSTGIANVGRYQFSPANIVYSGITSNQTAQNYGTLTFGDVVHP